MIAEKTFRLFTYVMPMALLVLGVWVLFPAMQYYIDPDATAYLSISEHYARAHWMRAINGYWSPWSCWLTAIGIRLGLASFPAAIVVNTMGAGVFLSGSHVLFRRVGLAPKHIAAALTTTAFFLIYAVYKQSFADLWAFGLLLLINGIFLGNGSHRVANWLLAGLLGGIAFYAKAYALPFLCLWFPACWWILKRHQRLPLVNVCAALLPMLLLVLPWAWLLHEKYGVWSTGTAGSLNLSWYLIGHPVWKPELSVLLPPAYPDAVSYWEDPQLVNGETPHFWNSWSLAALQGVRVGYNLLKWNNSIHELSPLFSLAFILAPGIVCFRNVAALFSDKYRLLSFNLLLFPAGYLLINFEARYLWCLVPVGMAMLIQAALLMQKLLPGKRAINILVGLVCGSFLLFPVWDMKTLYKQGAADYHTAQQLKRHGITGKKIATNIAYGAGMASVLRVAWFSGNAYYYLPVGQVTPADFYQDLKRYGIDYYIHFHQPFEQATVAWPASPVFTLQQSADSLAQATVFKITP